MPIETNCQEICENQDTIKYFIRPGISVYKDIMNCYNERQDSLLCYLFYNFYNIRGLKTEDKIKCLKYFLQHQNLTKEELYNKINAITKRNELSLTTKLFHTAKPDNIIIDIYVREFCGRKNDALNIKLWNDIEQDLRKDRVLYLGTIFDNLFSDSREISTSKKIDFMIWGWGKWKKWKIFDETYQKTQ